jgi:hypothetical protein
MLIKIVYSTNESILLESYKLRHFIYFVVGYIRDKIKSADVDFELY